MGKRSVEEEEESDIDVSSTDGSDVETQDHEGNDEEMEEIVNVDFDYFDLNPTVDFHATKTFLRQLFGDDCNHFDISGLADLILGNNMVGTTIKTDGQEGDPFALLSVIDATSNLSKPCVKTVVEYVLSKTKEEPEFNMVLKKLLSPSKTAKAQLKVGLIFSERMLNMPVEVVPPLYKMLLEELERVQTSNEEYNFDYYLVISKIYKLVNSSLTDDDIEKTSKRKKVAKNDTKAEEFDYFHYEDMVLEKHCKYHGHYEYNEKHQESDSRRVFTEYGIDPRLSLILIDKNGLRKSVPEMEKAFPPF